MANGAWKPWIGCSARESILTVVLVLLVPPAVAGNPELPNEQLSELRPDDIISGPDIETSFKDDRTQTVYFLTVMFNRAPLFSESLASMQRMADADQNIFWIVVDYGTPGLDVEKSLQQAKIQHHYINVMSKRFSRTLGLQIALETVPYDDSIVMAMDLLVVPKDLASQVRRYVVPGKTIFAPVCWKLGEGEKIGSNVGEFYEWGWGLIGFQKADAMKFDGWEGANKDKLDPYKWGCEDVNFANKLSDQSLVAVRPQLRQLEHITLSVDAKTQLEANLPKHLLWKSYSEGKNNNCFKAFENSTIFDEAQFSLQHFRP